MARKKAFPKTPGGCVDAIYKLDMEITATKKTLKEQEEQRSALAEHVQTVFTKEKITSAKTKNARVEFKPKHRWNAEDWDKIHAYITKNKAWDLMQKRLSDKAIDDRIEDGKKIPGVKKFSYNKMSITEKK